jgi:hypothetical protein
VGFPGSPVSEALGAAWARSAPVPFARCRTSWLVRRSHRDRSGVGFPGSPFASSRSLVAMWTERELPASGSSAIDSPNGVRTEHPEGRLDPSRTDPPRRFMVRSTWTSLHRSRSPVGTLSDVARAPLTGLSTRLTACEPAVLRPRAFRFTCAPERRRTSRLFRARDVHRRAPRMRVTVPNEPMSPSAERLPIWPDRVGVLAPPSSVPSLPGSRRRDPGSRAD